MTLGLNWNKGVRQIMPQRLRAKENENEIANQTQTKETSSKQVISLWMALKNMIKYILKIKSTDKKDRLYLKSYELYSKRLDICFLMNKIQEIDKLKAVLLSPKQKSMFNLMTKPLVMSCSRSSGGNGEILTNMMNEDLEYDKAVVSKIVNDMDQNNDSSEVDKRLLRLIEKKYINQKNNFA